MHVINVAQLYNEYLDNDKYLNSLRHFLIHFLVFVLQHLSFSPSSLSFKLNSLSIFENSFFFARNNPSISLFSSSNFSLHFQRFWYFLLITILASLSFKLKLLSLFSKNLIFFCLQQWAVKKLVLLLESILARPTRAWLCGKMTVWRSYPTTKGTGRRRLMWLSLMRSIWSVMWPWTRSPWIPATPSTVKYLIWPFKKKLFIRKRRRSFWCSEIRFVESCHVKENVILERLRRSYSLVFFPLFASCIFFAFLLDEKRAISMSL